MNDVRGTGEGEREKMNPVNDARGTGGGGTGEDVRERP